MENRFKKMSLMRRAELVYKFQMAEPAAKKAFEDFFAQQKQKNAVKHLPNVLFVASKKLELAMDKVLTDWINGIQIEMKEKGFGAFAAAFEPAVFGFYLHNDKPLGPKSDLLFLDDIFNNKPPLNLIDKAIWIMAEGFYNETLFEKNAVTKASSIKEGKPYLIEALKIPNLNPFSATELGAIKNEIHNHIASFKEEAMEWASQCSTQGNGANYFVNKLLPTFKTVEEAINNNPMIKHWENIKDIKKASTIYFGEVSPIMLWDYYKKNIIISETLYNQLVEDYTRQKDYTVPVMVIGYNMDALKLAKDPNMEPQEQTTIQKVKRFFNID
jgi:hypothetical protein